METTTGFISTLGATSDCGYTIRVKEARRKVALVCMVDSIHTARWIEMFANENIDFYLLPSTPNRIIHPLIRERVLGKHKQMSSVKIVPLGGFLSIPLFIIDVLVSNTIRGLILSRLITRLKIDYVHALELNHGGYIVSRSKNFGGSSAAKYISTNWGSDIYWFQNFPRHRKKIEKLMAQSDFYSAECNRDVELATKYGFKGHFMEVFPNAGGLPVKLLKENLAPPSERNLILIKGYESFVGRASIALSAVQIVAEQIRDFEVIVYSANKKTIRLVNKMNKKYHLKIQCFPKKALSHDAMLGLFKKARIYLGISLSDGISTSLLEAISTGAFPIQSNTSCANEWIEDGKTGFIVPIDSKTIAYSLSLALNDNKLVDDAMKRNLGIASSRLDSESIKYKALRFYRK